MPTLGLRADQPLAAWPRQGLIGILDLEYTAWDGSAGRHWSESWEWREIVQIGLVLVDAGSMFAVRDGFEILAKPQRNPVLSDYFVALTGITQRRLDEEAVAFPEALSALAKFGAAAELFLFNGYDGEILRENCSFHALAAPWPEDRMFDFRPLLSRSLGRPSKELVSSDLPRLAGTSVAGRSHSALHDCRAIAAAFAAWRSAGLL
jgi:inhibitor of KinA sporulation pathway (predicted exonuclease)